MPDRSPIAEVIAEAWRRPRPIKVSDWAERERIITSRDAAEPGKWSHDRAPYLREIMDSWNDPAVRQITIIKGERTGGTECILTMLGYTIDENPGPTLYVVPNEISAQKFNREKLQPMVRNTPALARHLTTNKRDLASMECRFRRMTLTLTGSNSRANLEQMGYRDVLIDEFDRCEPDTLDIVRGRGMAFEFSKIVCNGTPEDEGGGISAQYARSDQRRYYVPCPNCGLYAPRRWANVKWEGGAEARSWEVRKAAWYRCEGCSEPIAAAHNGWQLRRGAWAGKGWIVEKGGTKVRDPSVPDTDMPDPSHVGFAVGGLLNPFTANPYGLVASEFVANGCKPTRAWANLRLGEAWASKGAGLKASSLRVLCKPPEAGGYLRAKLPVTGGSCRVKMLTCAVDVQADRLYAEVVGWGDGVAATIEIAELRRSPKDQLAELSPFLLRRYTAIGAGGELLADLPIHLAIVDSGNFSDEVYRFCRLRSAAGWDRDPRGERHARGPMVFPSKGKSVGGGKVAHFTEPEKGVDGKPLATSVWLLMIDTVYFKTDLYDELEASISAADPLQAPLLFPEDVPDWYFDQLTGEERVRDIVRGRRVDRWKIKSGRENHMLDARVMNKAARHVAPMWPELRALLTAKEPPKPGADPKPAKPVRTLQRRSEFSTSEAAAAFRD